MSIGPLYLPATFENVPHIAVCAGRPGGHWMHAGIVFRDHSGRRLVLDIDINGNISAGTIEQKQAEQFAWAIPQFPELALKQLAAFCEFIASKSPNLPYSFGGLDTANLVAAGHDIRLSGACGLTCTNFVIAVFRRNLMELVDAATWQHRNEDEQFQRDVHSFMESRITDQRFYGLTKDRVDSAGREIPSLRCRPEEVVAACRVGNHPTKMQDVVRVGEETRRWIDETDALIR
jgi:hypothetical protein